MQEFIAKELKRVKAFQYEGPGSHISKSIKVRIIDEADGSISFWCEKSQEYVRLQPGGYIVEEPDGKGYYPVTREIFEDAYELVVEEGIDG